MAIVSGTLNWTRRKGKDGNEWWSYEIPLEAGDTLISPELDLVDFSEIIVNVDTDTNCTAWIDLSLKPAPDPTNDADWDRNIPRIVNQTIGSGGLRTIASGSTYARVRVINGTDTQTHLRVLVRLSKISGAGLTSSMNQVISIGDEVRLQRVINDHDLDVAAGFYSDRFSISKFGENPSVGTGAYEDIWANGGLYPWPTAAETVRARSGGNAADTATGEGARKVIVEGLDENWDRASEEITLAGASASAATTTTFIRVFRAYVTDSGTYGAANTGAIIIENTSSTDVLANIAADIGQSQLALYTIPANYKGYIRRIAIDVDASKPSTVRMWKREAADDTTVPVTAPRIQRLWPAVSGAVFEDLRSPIVLAEKTDIWFSALASSGGASSVEVDFDIEVIFQLSTTPQ